MAQDTVVGVIGGSGLYRLTEDADWTRVTTPYGDPSDSIALGAVGERNVAFLPRHGRHHELPAHRINHRANLWALRSLGVERIIAPCAVGSLRAEIAPGGVVICDQFIDNTGGGADATFFDGPDVAHVSMADPYCAQLRPLAAASARRCGFAVHDTGTVVVVRGPRFSTRAESRRFRADGGAVINMTQYPEVALARELGLCYVTLSLVTDYDTGVDGQPEREAVTQAEVIAEFARHTDRLRRTVVDLVAEVPRARTCECHDLRAVPLTH